MNVKIHVWIYFENIFQNVFHCLKISLHEMCLINTL